MKHIIYFFSLNFLIVLFGMTKTLSAQDNGGYIFGTIYTHSGQEYTGFMQWGKEEIYWHDLFNSNKIEDKFLFDNKSSENENWFNFEWDFGSIWDDKYKTSDHTFACYFGDIDQLDIHSNSKVDLTFKNGQTIKLRGGSNDVGATIRMTDYELGTIKLKWSKIDKIKFSAVPPELEAPYGIPLYGKVHTKRKGIIEGFIAWDLDERHGNAVLDGDSEDGDQEIPFSKISVIEKEHYGANITLKSGREFFLDGSNDVDSGNRGIEVYSDLIGSVQVSWKEFDRLELEHCAQAGPSYYSFEVPNGLIVDVETFDDERISGAMIFDIDEMWEPEILDGEDDYIKYQIPFRFIKEIYPKNKNYSIIVLHNGNELLLGNTQDVSNSNDGLILFSNSSKEPINISWDDIVRIKIKG